MHVIPHAVLDRNVAEICSISMGWHLSKMSCLLGVKSIERYFQLGPSGQESMGLRLSSHALEGPSQSQHFSPSKKLELSMAFPSPVRTAITGVNTPGALQSSFQATFSNFGAVRSKMNMQQKRCMNGRSLPCPSLVH